MREHLNSDNQGNNDPPLFWYLNTWAFSRLGRMSTLLEGPLFIFIFTNMSEKRIAIIYLWYGLILDLNCIFIRNLWFVYLKASFGLSIKLWVLLCDDLLDLNLQRLNISSVDILVIYALVIILPCMSIRDWGYPPCFTTGVSVPRRLVGYLERDGMIIGLVRGMVEYLGH